MTRQSILAALFSSLLIAGGGVYSKSIVDNQVEKLSKSLPFPFSSPSDNDFCLSNNLGDDIYISAFLPCEFTFYKDDDALPPPTTLLDNTKRNQFTCDSMNEKNLVAKEQRKVIMWPDSCVSTQPRCYSISEYPGLYNYTMFNWDQNYKMEFPADATVVSVDCRSDYGRAKEFMDDLPEQLHELADAIKLVAWALVVLTITLVLVCGIFCFGWFFRSCGSKRDNDDNYNTKTEDQTSSHFPAVALDVQQQPRRPLLAPVDNPAAKSYITRLRPTKSGVV